MTARDFTNASIAIAKLGVSFQSAAKAAKEMAQQLKPFSLLPEYKNRRCVSRLKK